MITEKLTRLEINLCEKETVYSLKEIRAKCFRVDDLAGCGGDYYLAFLADPATWLKFGLFEYCVKDFFDDGDTHVCVLWQGEGPRGLRELRHSYFGEMSSEDERGYIFFAPLDVLCAATVILRDYFN